MTTEVRDKIWQKLGEFGIVVLMMAVIIYVLYTRSLDMEQRMQKQFDEYREDTKKDIMYLKDEVSKCRDENTSILLETNRNYIEIIEKNNRLIENLKR